MNASAATRASRTAPHSRRMMTHGELCIELKRLERGLHGLRGAHDHDFRRAFEARVAQLSAQAQDPDDAVYVIERADTMLGDLGLD